MVAVAGIITLVLLIVAASIASWLEMRNGHATTPVYGTPSSALAAVWTWDGARYTLVPYAGQGPSSNKADMAYDLTRRVLVLWDHGCTGLVMGFQGGCVAHANQTWIWDGASWKARSPRSAPKDSGQGAMLFDARLGQVVYVNGAGQAWTWTGADWISIETRGSLRPVAVGYDEFRRVLVFALAASTWTWDGNKWTEMPGGIEAGEARSDAHLVFDRMHGQLVYVGSRFTWTWDGTRWQNHPQPGIASGVPAYDAARGSVILVQQDSAACDQTACRTTIWTWDSKAWTQVFTDGVPLLPLTRSGASLPPMAFDEARGLMVLVASAS
jgi:hypothetical protein